MREIQIFELLIIESYIFCALDNKLLEMRLFG